jgi:hypothetical protein
MEHKGREIESHLSHALIGDNKKLFTML